MPITFRKPLRFIAAFTMFAFNTSCTATETASHDVGLADVGDVSVADSRVDVAASDTGRDLGDSRIDVALDSAAETGRDSGMDLGEVGADSTADSGPDTLLVDSAFDSIATDVADDSEPVPQKLEVSPFLSSPSIDTDTKFTASMTTSDGWLTDVTSLATWTSSDITLATVSATGIARAIKAGVVDIRATYRGLTSRGTLEISDERPRKLTISPAGPIVLTIGSKQTFIVTASLGDGTDTEVSPAFVKFTSSVAGTLSFVDNEATALSAGDTVVSATFGSLTTNLVDVKVTK